LQRGGLLDRIITSDGEARFFTTLDFTTAFWQLVLDPESRKYTGFKVDGRVYQMIRLPYGLKISSAEFVKVINEVIPDMPGVTKYVDDLLLRSLTFSEMLRLLKKVLELLREHGLKLNPNKCKFFASSTDHLGFNISTRSIKKQSKKIEGYLEYIQKKTLKRTGKVKLGNVRDVLTLIGLTGIYSRFIPNYQDIVKPLYDLTRKGVPFVWGTAQEEAVEKLTVEFTKEFELMSPVDGEDLYLDTVSTEHSLNGVLYQNIKGEDKVVMFVSSAFKQHQQNYTLIEREMFALVRVINKLQLWLHGRRIHVRGDLQSVVHKFTTLAKVHRKAAGWITELNCYDLVYDLKHKVRGQWYGIQAPELTVYDTNWTNMVPLDVSFVELVKDEVLDHLRRLDIFQSHEFSANMPTKLAKLNSKYLLKKLQQDQIEKNPKSVTTETLMEKPMELSNLIRDEDGYYWAAVDGACSNNGSSDAIAGIGVAWTPTGEFNISERVDHPRYRNTNNLAEAIALCKAMKVMLKLGAKRGKIFSDSCYLTTAINYNVEKWKINNWKNASKKPVVHREIFQEILELKEKFEKFELKHTPARSFDRNNHAADKLARKAVYTQELVDLRVDEMTEQQALISFIREKRKLQRSRDEVAFYKIKGDPICYEEGELVMLTEHRQSSYDKGVSKKLFPKRFGPYMVMKHVGDNAYRVRSIANESDEQIVNA
ncbi:unnamed protein product, partial [Allacma fusca]